MPRNPVSDQFAWSGGVSRIQSSNVLSTGSRPARYGGGTPLPGRNGLGNGFGCRASAEAFIASSLCVSSWIGRGAPHGASSARSSPHRVTALRRRPALAEPRARPHRVRDHVEVDLGVGHAASRGCACEGQPPSTRAQKTRRVFGQRHEVDLRTIMAVDRAYHTGTQPAGMSRSALMSQPDLALGAQSAQLLNRLSSSRQSTSSGASPGPPRRRLNLGSGRDPDRG